MAIRFAFALFVLSIAAQAKANGYVLATDGYYYLNGQAYTRTSTLVDGYYYRTGCGYSYYPGYYTYSYTPYVTVIPATPAVKYSKNWKSDIVAAELELADIAAFQDAHDAYQRKIPAVRGAFPYFASLGSYNNAVFGAYGINTSAQYGFQLIPTGLSQYAGTQYNQIDPQSQLLTFQQTVNDMGAAFSGAVKDTGGLVDRAVSGQQANQDREARRRLVANAFADFLRGIDQPVQTSSSVTGKFSRYPVSPAPAVAPAAPALDTSKPLQDRFNVAATKCADCHYGDKREGGWILTDLSNPNILDRLIRPASDPKHMPKGSPSISIEELQTWREAIASDAATAKKPEMPKLSK
jgi:hypothetical protein